MKCVICGKTIEESKFSTKNLCSSECFHIDFWNDAIIESKNYHKNPIIDGNKYHVGDKSNKYRGFGGQEFIIEFFDGTKIKTTNLYHNGKVPETHKALLLDNAKFIKNN